MAESNTHVSTNGTVRFTIGDMIFEYDKAKEAANILKHGVSLRSAARVFFDYDRIELYDENHSEIEERFNTIGDTSAGNPDITRLISARQATSFERGIYYGKFN